MMKTEKTKMDRILVALRIAVTVVLLIWLVFPHLEEYQDGGNKAWRAPAYITVNYHMPQIGIEKTRLYPFPYSMMQISEIWDKCEKEESGISWEEIGEKLYEQAKSQENYGKNTIAIKAYSDKNAKEGSP